MDSLLIFCFHSNSFAAECAAIKGVISNTHHKKNTKNCSNCLVLQNENEELKKKLAAPSNFLQVPTPLSAVQSRLRTIVGYFKSPCKKCFIIYFVKFKLTLSYIVINKNFPTSNIQYQEKFSFFFS